MVEGFVEWTRARGGSASPQDPPRTSLGKTHGPEGGTQSKNVTWKQTGLVVLLSAFDFGVMVSLLRSPLCQLHKAGFSDVVRRRGRVQIRTWQTEAKLGVTPRIVPWREVLRRAEVVVGHIVQHFIR